MFCVGISMQQISWKQEKWKIVYSSESVEILPLVLETEDSVNSVLCKVV